MCRVYFWEIDESKHDEWLDKLGMIVSVEKYSRAMRFRFPIDRMLTICAEALVRSLACGQLKIRNKNIEFGQNEFGKPYLKGYPKFYFNISHTRNALAVAVSDSEVGVDIERVKAAEHGISDRFFALPEREYIVNSLNPDKAFYEVWTRKESYIKYIGQGLSMSLTSFSVLDTELENLTTVFERGDYLISVCNKGQSPVSIYDVDVLPFC